MRTWLSIVHYVSKQYECLSLGLYRVIHVFSLPSCSPTSHNKAHGYKLQFKIDILLKIYIHSFVCCSHPSPFCIFLNHIYHSLLFSLNNQIISQKKKKIINFRSPNILSFWSCIISFFINYVQFFTHLRFEQWIFNIYRLHMMALEWEKGACKLQICFCLYHIFTMLQLLANTYSQSPIVLTYCS